MDFKKKKFSERLINFFDSKGFYIIIVVCLIIIGASIYTIVSNDYSRYNVEEKSTEKIQLNTKENNKQSQSITQLPKSTEETSVDKTKIGESIKQTNSNKSQQETTNITSSKNTVENNATTQVTKTTSKVTQKIISDKTNIIEQAPSSTQIVTENKADDTLEVINPVNFKPIYPLLGKVSLEYSDETLTYSKTLDEWTVHNGIDIQASKGSDVKACFDGTVIDIGNDPLYGYYIMIDHGDGYVSKYCNLESIKNIQLGQLVKQGQKIGQVGQTAEIESLDPPHLHFEILFNNKNENPLKYLPPR
ncbi:peptidoglycan DD-metalloendopeptidase family protein [Caldicellulosiruptoraceae bacterium PP1]